MRHILREQITDEMKALSLWQPWATLMAIEAKRNETRGWRWAYVGDVAICAAAKKLGQNIPEDWIPALRRLYEFKDTITPGFRGDVRDLYYSLPFGQVVCVVEKFACRSTTDDNGDDRSLTPLELDLGDYGPYRFYFPTRNCRRLKTPVPVFGRQGPFELPPSVAAAVQVEIGNQLTPRTP